MALCRIQRIGTLAAISIFCGSLLSAVAQDRGAIAENSIVAITPGTPQRIRLIEDEQTRVEGEYPSEGLRYGIPGHAAIKFTLDGDGRVTGPTPGEGAAYDATLRMLRRLTFFQVEDGRSGAADSYVAIVHFIAPPCVPWEASINIDYSFTVCGSSDPTASLRWEDPWP